MGLTKLLIADNGEISNLVQYVNRLCPKMQVIPVNCTDYEAELARAQPEILLIGYPRKQGASAVAKARELCLESTIIYFSKWTPHAQETFFMTYQIKPDIYLSKEDPISLLVILDYLVDGHPFYEPNPKYCIVTENYLEDHRLSFAERD